MLKTLIYPFVAGKVAVEMAFAEAHARVRKELHSLVAETLSDAKEINELKAEIAVLRAEINEVKYGGIKNAKISAL